MCTKYLGVSGDENIEIFKVVHIYSYTSEI